MVTFRLIEEDEQRIVYWYFPEGKEDKGHGIIIVDKIQEEIDITEVAPDDFERDIPAEELNELAEAINKMKREAGETDFVEMTTESEHSIYYGDHAVREIIKYLRKGEVPPRGMQMWYKKMLPIIGDKPIFQRQAKREFLFILPEPCHLSEGEKCTPAKQHH